MNLRALLLVFASVLACWSCGSHGTTGVSADAVSDSTIYARGFVISESSGYTTITVKDPWKEGRILHTYVLVPADSRIDGGLPQGTVIRVPVCRAAIYSTVHAAIVEELGSLDMVAGLCETEYATSPEVKRRIVSGQLADFGQATSPNIEKMLDEETDLVIDSPYENAGPGAAEKLGIPVFEAADYMEKHPLGRVEWIKVFGCLFQQQAKADSIFNATVARYNEIKALAASVAVRPTVVLERKYGSSWLAPASNSYIARIHSDAGASYIFDGLLREGVMNIPLETVLDKAETADFWLFKYSSRSPYTYEDLKEEYPPYSRLKAFRQKSVFGCNTVGSSYYDDIALHPDRLLEDLVSIYHPELLPEYEARYYFPL